jgi:hypothetical protein
MAYSIIVIAVIATLVTVVIWRSNSLRKKGENILDFSAIDIAMEANINIVAHKNFSANEHHTLAVKADRTL